MDALSEKLRDPDFLMRLAATHEPTSDHIRNGIQMLWDLREQVEDATGECGVTISHIEFRMLAALVVDAHTVKLDSAKMAEWDLDYGEPRGPRLVVDQTVAIEEEDGA